MKKYKKACINRTDAYRIDYGAGIYDLSEHNPVLYYDTDLSITYYIACRGTLKVEGRVYELQNGDFVIADSREIRCCLPENSSYYERVSFSIKNTFMETFCPNYVTLLDAIYRRESGMDNVIRPNSVMHKRLSLLAEEMLSLSKSNSEKNQILCTCKLVEFLIYINEALLYQKENTLTLATENPLILQVIEYIDKHLTTISGCEEIASRFFISKYRLEHLFKECVDISLWDYVIIKRLLHFNTIVREGASIKKAAYASGFKNYSNFYRLYKKHMNHTPTEFKQQIRSDAHTSSK